MRECLSIHLGQCGAQIGDTCWDLLCREHTVQADGQLASEDNPTLSQVDRLGSFFQESHNGRYTPRSLFIDLEPSVIDGIFHGERGRLYSKDNTLAGKEDAANNFARGFYGVGRQMIEPAMDLISKTLEGYDSFQGFFIFSSFGGGTGSGFTSLLLQEINNTFDAYPKLEFSVAPSPQMSTAVVEPYNAVMRGYSTQRHSDCVLMMDNESLYNISRTQLNVERPSSHNLNALVAQAFSSVTSSLRFDGTLNVDLGEFQTNLVPFPSIHFPVVSYSPFVSKENAYAQDLSTKEMTRNSLEPGAHYLKCAMDKGKYMACCFLYRGDVQPNDVNSAIDFVKARKDVQFVDWCPTGFKVGINGSRPVVLDEHDQSAPQRAVCTLANNTAVGDFWSMLCNKYDLMFAKRAFVHWYLEEGMEEGEFLEARDSLAELVDEYGQLEREGNSMNISMQSDF